MQAADRPRRAEQIDLVHPRAEHLTGYVPRRVGGEKDRHRRVLVRRHLLNFRDPRPLLFGARRDRLGHAAPRPGRQAIRTHIEPLHVDRDRFRQGRDAELGRSVIRLAHIADQPRSAGDVNVGAAFLLAVLVGRRTTDKEAAGEVNRDHREPVLGRHAVKDLITQNAGVVDDDIEPAEMV